MNYLNKNQTNNRKKIEYFPFLNVKIKIPDFEMQETNPFNINITRGNDRADEYNQFKEYLILNHLDLQKETRVLKDEISGLKIELHEKETEEDKYDTRTRYFRSLLINLNELKKGYQHIISKKQELLDITNNKLDSLYNINKQYYIKLIVLNMLYLLEHLVFQYFKLTSIKITIYLIINSTLVYAIIYKYLLLYDYIETSKNVKDPSVELIKTEIKKKTKELINTDDATLSLDNWVYEV